MTEMVPPAPPRLALLRGSLPMRLTAAAIHLAASAAVFAVALYLILARWYPGFHFTVDGGWSGARLTAAVGLVLGPLLTLVVFNPFKARRLIVLDLACTISIQAVAVAWGLQAMHSQRPVAVSFYEGAFVSVTAAPLAIERRPADYANQFSDRRPPLVYVAEPKDEQEATRAAMQELLGQVAAHEDPFFFRRLDAHWADVRARAADVRGRATAEPSFAAALAAFLAEHGGQAADYLFFPYEGKEGACTVAFRPDGSLVNALGCRRY